MNKEEMMAEIARLKKELRELKEQTRFWKKQAYLWQKKSQRQADERFIREKIRAQPKLEVCG